MKLEPATSSRLAAAATLLVIAMTIAAVCFVIVLELDASYDPSRSLADTAPDLIFPLVFGLVGGLVAVNRPGNLVGWSMLISALGWLAGGFIGAYGEVALLAAPEAGLPLGRESVAISGSLWTPLMAGIFLLLLLFPAGQVPSQRWRFVAPLVLVGFALVTFGLSTAPSEMGEIDPTFQGFGKNPLAFVNSDLYLVPFFALIAFCLSSIVAAAIDLFFRFRRSRGEERQQYKWLAFAAGILAFSIPFSGTEGLGIVAKVADVTFGIGLFAVPAAVGIAVLRYRLYEIDRIISRTLVYALLTLALAATYFGLVIGLEAALRPISGSSDIAIVITTLVVAALFLPVRRRVQNVVDRRFNRRAYNAARTIDAFSLRLRDQIDLDTLRYELLAVVDETMQPAKVSVWLRNRNDLGTV